MDAMYSDFNTNILLPVMGIEDAQQDCSSSGKHLFVRQKTRVREPSFPIVLVRKTLRRTKIGKLESVKRVFTHDPRLDSKPGWPRMLDCCMGRFVYRWVGLLQPVRSASRLVRQPATPSPYCRSGERFSPADHSRRKVRTG